MNNLSHKEKKIQCMILHPFCLLEYSQYTRYPTFVKCAERFFTCEPSEPCVQPCVCADAATLFPQHENQEVFSFFIPQSW